MIEFSGSTGGRWLMGTISVAAVLQLLIMIPLAWQSNYYGSRDVQTKMNLHAIQLALERYSVDDPAYRYPEWLSGGGSSLVLSPGSPRLAELDPLILGGYLTAYPRNPFAVHGRHAARQLESLQKLLKDPLRPGQSTANLPVMYRFGEDYSLMGNLLASSPAPARDNVLQYVARDSARLPGAGITYPCWDGAAVETRQYWLQGQFYYRPWCRAESRGDFSADPDESDFQLDAYTLGAFGNYKNKGQDVLSEEQLAITTDADGSPERKWTLAGTVAEGATVEESSPFNDYIFDNPLGESRYLRINRSNGIADRVIIVLESGTS